MKKFTSIFTLMAFVVFSISCSVTGIKEVKKASKWHGKKWKILWITKTSGEYIEFSKDNPGLISGDKITGTAIILSKEIILERGAIKRVKKHQDGRVFEVTDKKGKIYHVVGLFKEESYKVIFFVPYESSGLVSIPLLEVKSVYVKRVNPLIKPLLVFAGFSGILWAVMLIGVGLMIVGSAIAG